MRFDPVEAAELADPYPLYAQLRAQAPVVRAGPGTWAVTRHRDVTALLSDARLSHVFPEAVYRMSGEPPELTEFFRATVLNRDPPAHTVLRRAMAHLIGPRAVAGLRPLIERRVGELFAAMAGRDDADLVTDLAYPLPVTVAANLLGIPDADLDQAQPHAVALGRIFGAGRPTEQQRGEAVAAVAWLRDYVADLLRGGPLARLAGDILDSGQISRAELIDNIIFLFFAGFETTTNLLSTGCAQLVHRPELLDLIRRNPALATTAVDEFLRFDAPIHSTARVALARIDLGEVTIRPGRMVILLLASANHDESRFPQPQTIDLGRSPNPHLGFSSGPHHCLGATLARIEAAAVFQQLATRTGQIVPAAPPIPRRELGFRGYAAVAVEVRN